MLDSAKAVFQKLSEAVVWPPSRDQLAAERDALLAAMPPAPVDTLTPSAPPACSCPHCTTRADEEQRVRVAFASWEARLKAVERGLFAMTWGNETERDALGTELAELHAELRRAADTNRARAWERVVEYAGGGKPLRAYETSTALHAIARDLHELYRRANGPMVFLASAELAAALTQTRAQLAAALARPLRQPLPPDVAQRAGTQPGPTDEVRKLGLVPGGGSDPSILSGTLRFTQRGRA